MARIIMLAPFPDYSQLTEFARQEYRDFPDLTVLGTDTGLDVVISYYQIEYHLGPILEKAIEIERQGNCDALIIGCFGDPGLVAVRQVTSMPVLGTGETSLCVAAMMGDKIGIIVPQQDYLYVTEKMIHTYQFTDRVVAIRSAEELVPETIMTKPQESVAKMGDVCLQLIQQDHADVVVFGCIGFSWMAHQIRKQMAEDGLLTPLIEPGITVYHAARMIIELKLNQDRRKLKKTN
jgi:allantoin racemase